MLTIKVLLLINLFTILYVFFFMKKAALVSATELGNRLNDIEEFLEEIKGNSYR